MAGHDYLTQQDVSKWLRRHPQNWTVNYDGTVDPTGGAVKGGVDDLAGRRNRQLSISYAEIPPTWAMRK